MCVTKAHIKKNTDLLIIDNIARKIEIYKIIDVSFNGNMSNLDEIYVIENMEYNLILDRNVEKCLSYGTIYTIEEVQFDVNFV